MRTNRHWLVVFLSIALALVLVACNSADDVASDTPEPEAPGPTEEVTATPESEPSPAPTVEPTPTPTSTPEPSTTPTVEPTPEPTPTSEPTPDEQAGTANGFTVEELEAFLLELDDVPDGWTAVPSFGSPTENPPCETVDPPTTLVDAPFAQVDFEREDDDALLSQIVLWLESDEDAVSALEWFDSAFQCDGRDDEVGTILEISELPFTEMGDESFAWKLTIGDGDEQLLLQYAFVRQGQFLSMAAQGGSEAPDADLLAELARAAVEKLPE